MDILDYFYNKSYSHINFFPRKYLIEKGAKTLIYGVPSCGKTYIVLDYLNSLEEGDALYIDLQDPKLKFNQIAVEDIERFISKNGIKTLILDHYIPNQFIKFPAVDELIVVSNIPSDEFNSFNRLRVSYLDYEEFFSFQKKNSQKYIFNLFLKRGTIVQLAVDLNRPKEELLKNFLRVNFSELERNLLIVLSHFNSLNVTPYHIYTYAKRYFKISKDSVYKKIREFLDRGIIFFIEDRLNRGSKRLILCDFALANYLSLSQKFLKQFDSMVAISLIKHNIKFNSFDNLGYLTSNGVLVIPAPFDSRDTIYSRFKSNLSPYIRYGIESICIVTVSLQYELYIDGIYFEAMPFYEWVLINGEF